MALNETQWNGKRITVALSGITSGDPVAVGNVVGVAQTNTLADGNVNLDTSGSVYGLAVQGKTNAGANSAVAFGDLIYIDMAATYGARLSKDTSKVLFGVALGAVTSGGAATINVKVHVL